MKAKILKTKVSIYFLLMILTGVCVCFTIGLYDNDLEKRTIPQVRRAIVQVSQLLPQLEENELAVREVYDHLVNIRQAFYQNNEETHEGHNHEVENVDAIIDKTLSWMNRVTKLRVGQKGHVIVVSQDDFMILAHPDKKFVGETLYTTGKYDTDDIIDISEIGEKKIPDDFQIFFPTSFFDKGIGTQRFADAFDAGIYGTAFSYKDTYILCGITLGEAFGFIIIRSFFTVLFFFSIAWVFVRYVGFSLKWQKEKLSGLKSKLASYAVIAVVLTFVVTWYYQTIMDVTGDITTMNEHAEVAVETLNTYQKYRNELSAWMDSQCLEQCYMARDIVKARGKENLTRADLAQYAQELGVDYIYIFDKNGKTIVTNSPYDHFEISKDPEAQSYAFRPLLDGREYVIQEPMKDESSDTKMQYIGVSLRDENDLADGFVQIAVDPVLRDRLLAPINVQTVLDNLVIGLPEYALAIDKDTMEIVGTTGLGQKKTSIEDLGIEADSIKKGLNGIISIEGDDYYAGVSESEDLYLMPLVSSTDNNNAIIIAFKLALFSVAAYVLFILIALFSYDKILKLRKLEGEKNSKEDAIDEDADAGETEDSEEEDEERGIFHNLTGLIKTREKRGFEDRWKSQSAIPLEEQSPEMRIERIIKRMLLIYSVVLLSYVFILVSLRVKTTELNGLSYVFLGEWESGFNLFSFTFCLFLLCGLYTIEEFLNQILYRIARISDTKRETLLLLTRNALKYICAAIFLYIGLAKFGVNTKALWASVGVFSLMVGFGAKDLINDIIAGVFNIFENTYQVGDFIKVGDWWGTVEEIGLRYTKVRFFSETKIFNNSSLRDVINCDGDVAREVLKIPIPYETDLLEVEKLFERELPILYNQIPDMVKEPRYQGVSSFEDSSVILQITIYCNIHMRGRVRRDAYRAIKLLFDREHINIPYNHVVVSDYEKEENTYTFMPAAEPEEANLSDENDKYADA